MGDAAGCRRGKRGCGQKIGMRRPAPLGGGWVMLKRASRNVSTTMMKEERHDLDEMGAKV
jgi:hypothetical protein